MELAKWKLSCVAALLVAGCGGGDGDGGPGQPPVSFDVAAAMRGIARDGDEYHLSGSMLGMPATLVATHSARSDAAFSTFGTLNRFSRTAVITIGNQAPETGTEDHYLDLAGRTFYGMIDGEGNMAVSDSRWAYPATATVGSDGSLYSATIFDWNGFQQGKITIDWTLEGVAGESEQADLCLWIQFRYLSGAPTGDSEKDCYRIDPTGNRLGLRITFTLFGIGSFTFQ